jgi:hypothetical protein
MGNDWKVRVGASLDQFKRTLALTESEAEEMGRLVGFVPKPDLIARLGVMKRLSVQISEVLEWWTLNPTRVGDAVRETEAVLGGLKATQKSFLVFVAPRLLSARLEKLRCEPWFSYMRAQALADGLVDFRQSTTLPLAELRVMYVKLEGKFMAAEDTPAAERVKGCLSSPPPKKRRGKKVRKDMAAQAKR